MQRRRLPSCDFLALFPVRLENAEQSSFAQNPEPAVSKDGRAPSEGWRLRVATRWRMSGPTFITRPHQLSCFEFDATKGGVWLVASAEGIKKAVVEHRRVPMNLEHRRLLTRRNWVAVGGIERVPRNAPNFVKRLHARLHAQEHRANTIVSGRNKNTVVVHHWDHGVDRIVGERLKPACKIDCAVRWI